jgi:hypothetical protein
MHLSAKKIAPQRKELENAPDATPFIPKGALMHTKRGTNAYQKGHQCTPKNAYHMLPLTRNESVKIPTTDLATNRRPSL